MHFNNLLYFLEMWVPMVSVLLQLMGDQGGFLKDTILAERWEFEYST